MAIDEKDIELVDAYTPTVYVSLAGRIVLRVNCVLRKPLLLVFENNGTQRALLREFASDLLRIAERDPLKQTYGSATSANPEGMPVVDPPEPSAEAGIAIDLDDCKRYRESLLGEGDE